MEDMRKPDQKHLSSFILGLLVFFVVSGAYAAMFLVVRSSSESLSRIQGAFTNCYESIQNQRSALSHPDMQDVGPAVDFEAMDAAVLRFKELSAILWMHRNENSALAMEIAWNDWKRESKQQLQPTIESRQLLQALKNARIQLGDLNRRTRDAFDLAIFLLGLLFSLGTAGFIAFYARLRQSRLKEEFAAEHLKRALESEDEIRRAIALELHDGIAQDIAAARMLCERAGSKEADTQNLVHRAAQTLGDVNHKIRILCTELRPPALEILGLQEALRTFCDTESSRLAKTFTFISETEIPRLARRVEGNLYCILREAIINAAKHSRTGDVEVRSRIINSGKGGPVLVIEVLDHGFDAMTRHMNQGIGLGLAAMKERAEQIGADLLINLDPDGSLIRVTITIS